MSAFKSDVLSRFFADREQDVEVGGAVWTLRELSGYEVNLCQMLLIKQSEDGKAAAAGMVAFPDHYAQGIAFAVVAIDGQRGTLTLDEVRRLDQPIFDALQAKVEEMNRVEADTEEDAGN